MPDIGTTQITIAGVGTLSVSILIFLLVQMLKDFMPSIRNRTAMAALYLIALSVAAVVVGLTGPSWHGPMTWVAIAVTTILGAQIAKGFYADLFKVSIQGIPPQPDAEVPLDTVAVPPPQPPPQDDESL